MYKLEQRVDSARASIAHDMPLRRSCTTAEGLNVVKHVEPDHWKGRPTKEAKLLADKYRRLGRAYLAGLEYMHQVNALRCGYALCGYSSKSLVGTLAFRFNLETDHGINVKVGAPCILGRRFLGLSIGSWKCSPTKGHPSESLQGKGCPVQ